MGGGLIQLIYIGDQNIYLTDKPEITFFKTVYRRHTNFAIETAVEVLSGGTNFGKRSRCILSKKGDLLKNLCMYIKLPSLNKNKNINYTNSGNICNCCTCPTCLLNNDTSEDLIYGWANGIGHVIIEYAELVIGGQTIDKQYGEWLEIWMELTQTAEKRTGYYEMIGKKDQASFSYDSFKNELDVLVPLNFWFCRNVGLAIPLISLQYHEVELYVKFRDLNECWVSNKDNAPTPLGGSVDIDASLLVEYIFLDMNERHKFAQGSHLYLIEQVQTSFNTYDNKTGFVKIDLEFNQPVKQLIWLIQRRDVTNRASGVYNDQYCTYPKGNDWFNYSVSKIPWIGDGKDTFDTASIQFNGEDRVPNMPAKYYRLYQSYYHQTRTPNNMIYSYNFALKPEDHQPTGECNWSRIAHAKLLIKMHSSKQSDRYAFDVRVYAHNYNWLMITGGLAGLLFYD
jgi:hypothetical protein